MAKLRPMPRLAPVMRTTLSLISIAGMGFVLYVFSRCALIVNHILARFSDGLEQAKFILVEKKSPETLISGLL